MFLNVHRYNNLPTILKLKLLQITIKISYKIHKLKKFKDYMRSVILQLINNDIPTFI